eukprot:CAMPEP_0203877280 /NCGR_PEP_ID=MMETSP0359-20131031/21896_1 /ASSEMBLY_ACC=CAM_ASM_000338 /TAXON_ID=268821 /ORGANISM="Scrippsiella Hangoei, Strain SHTV-5" /LENGTH=942 /DNA_ID=CAMNT_0050796211 /DNA_START=34 /DNA_END=2859 /DNA_ORIENTATION=+
MASSFYSAATWQQGKKGPPPIFCSIGVRHPRNIEIDIELRNYDSLNELFAFVSRELARFDAGNVVITVAQIPKVAGDQDLGHRSQDPAWLELQDRMHRAVSRLEPRGLSMLAYALARIRGWRDDKLIVEVLEASKKRITDFGPTDTAKLAWVLAKLQIKEQAQELWIALSKEAAKKICTSGRFIDISMTAWAFAKAGMAERVLFGQLATAAMACTELPPHTIANLVWAFAKTKNPNPPLFDMLATRAVENVREFDRQSVSNTVWAYATLDVCHEELFAVFGKYTVESQLWRNFSPQMASNLLWAYAKVQITITVLFDAFAEYIALHAEEFDTQNISNCAWAYANAQLPSKGVFDTLWQRSRGRLDTFRLDELCGLLWAYAKAKVCDSPIFEEAIQLLLPRVTTLDQQSVSNIIWVLATAAKQRGSEVPGTRELFDALLECMLDLRVRVDSEGAAMVIWAFYSVGRFNDAWTLYVRTLSDGRHPEHGKTGFTKKHAVDGRQRYYQTLLMETERRGDVAKQVFLWKQMAADFYARSLRAACLNCAVMAMMNVGDTEGAKDILRQLVRTRLGTGVSESLARRLGLVYEELEPACIVDITLRRRPQCQSRFEDFHYKEAGVLETVVGTATPGDATSVHAAIENVGLKEVWLKVAGGEKSCVIDNVIAKHRPRLILEFGTYVGYTCSRMALQVAPWGGKVVSMEMDPVNATIARNHIEMCGLSHAVTVQLGHSDDAVQIVLDKYGPGSVDMVFMDQRGTAFHDDLQRLERIGLLSDPAVVVADNVLKPGAPYHVWRISSMPHYRTDIIDLREFGSAPVEDWMTVSWVHRGPTYGMPAEELRELTALARESDRFRLRAMATSMKDLVGDLLDEFAARFTAEFVRLNIRTSMYVRTDLVNGGADGAVSRLVRLAPGESPPKWEGWDPRDDLVGGRWRSHIEPAGAEGVR